MSGHGPDQASYDKAVSSELAPHKIDGTMAFMVETRLPYSITRFAAETELCQLDYDDAWVGFEKAGVPR